MARTHTLRRGLTLTELLVVVSIIIIVTAVLTPMLSPMLEGREVREAARQVNSYIQNARARAIELGRPVGVVFRRSDTNPELAYQMYLAEQPPPFMGTSSRSRAVLKTSSSTEGLIELVPPLPDDFLLIEANDYVRFNFRGSKYRIIAKSNPSQIKFRIEPDQTVNYLPEQALHFEIFRSPRQTASTPLELPTGTAIVLNLSGVGLIPPAVAPGLSSSIGMLEFGAPIEELELVDQAQNMPPLTIMFNANGEVDRIYRVLPHPNLTSGLKWRFLVRYPPKRPQGTIFLFLGRDGVDPSRDTNGDKLLPLNNLADASNLWIVIEPTTGRITTAPHAVSSVPVETLSPQVNSGDFTKYLAAVASSRQLAVSGVSVGEQ